MEIALNIVFDIRWFIPFSRWLTDLRSGLAELWTWIEEGRGYACTRQWIDQDIAWILDSMLHSIFVG